MDPINAAIKVTAIGMGGIFVFMFIFYLSIRLIDHFFPGNTDTK